MRHKLTTGSVLKDLAAGGAFGGTAVPWVPAPVEPVGVGNVTAPNLDQQVSTDLARTVIEIPFDDSVDSTHPLECFFQMPVGVVRVRSAKVWVQQKSFRAYETGSSSGGSVVSSSSGGGSTVTSGGGGGSTTTATSAHYHLVFSNTTNTGSGTSTTDSQGVHTHTEHDGFTTGASVGHSHNVLGHTHTQDTPQGVTSNDTAHYHSTDYHYHSVTVADHTHTTDTTHTHTITYGIFEQAASGNISLYVANDGSTFGAAKISGVSTITALEITPDITNLPGDKRIRVNATGLARVQVLLVLDLILQLGV